MSIINSQPRIGAAGQSTGFKIERSLRFNSADSAYLNRTPASAGNRKTWTWSGWVKRSALGTTQELFNVETVNGGTYTDIKFGTDNKLYLDSYGTTGALQARCVTDGVFRDVSAWYHVLAVLNTPNATAGDRAIIYVNGVRVSQTITDGFDLDAELMINTTNEHRIGADVLGNEGYFSGYLTEVHFIDGSAKTPSDFGETDTDTGVWKPKAYSGSYGTNGFYLKFADNSGTTSTTLGKDSSGNGNNWTPNNFSVTAGAGNDSLVDSPTSYGSDTGAGGEVRGNYCTANPLDIYPKSGTWTVSNGNLDLSLSGAVWDAIRGTTGVTSGKWYWEITATGIDNTNSYAMVGIQKGAGGNWQDPFAYVYYSLNGQKYNNGSGAAYGNSWTTNDVIGVAFDADAGEIKFYKNNTVQNSGTAAYTGLTSGPYTPVIMLNGTGSAATVTCNFGQRPFAYTAPSGFKALCTQNLPTPTIGATSATQAGKYFNTVLYTGNGSTQTISGVGFQPDLVWAKSRSNAYYHTLIDAVRGRAYILCSNITDAEVGPEPSDKELTAFTSDGFSLGPDYNLSINTNTATFVAWNWKANGAGSSNTAGSITSTVSANTTAGFSIVTYTGNGTSGATVGHGCLVNGAATTPSMVILKRRDAVSNWQVKHVSLNANQNLELNSTAAVDTAPGSGYISAISSTTLTLLNGGSAITNVNANTGTYLVYCFAPVAGYSAFGSYTGNGSSDGPFVYTGFRPAWVMIKKTSASGDSWFVFDDMRPGYNGLAYYLRPDLSNAEGTAYNPFDFVSNGFKGRDSDPTWNGNGATFVYAAFAEVPTKFSLAR